MAVMARSLSPVLLGVIVLLSATPGPSAGGRPMPKLAERKLCADEECSRESGKKEGGSVGSWPVCVLGRGQGCCHCHFLLLLP